MASGGGVAFSGMVRATANGRRASGNRVGPSRSEQGRPIRTQAAFERVPRTRTARIAACLVAGIAARSAAAAQWNGYVSLASDYVFRGVSLVDGASLQAGLEGRFADTFVAGAWAANVDRQWLYDRPVSNHLEVNLYAGVDVACGGPCRARFLVTGYEFPGPDAHDWIEATGSVALFERVGASFAWSPHGLGSGTSTRTVEGWFVQPLTRGTSLGFDGGKVWIGPFDYWFTRAGISQRAGRFVFDLSRYWSDPKYRHYGYDEHSQRWVLTVSTAF